MGDSMYKRIRDLREDHDLTQTQIAQILGMSQTGYSKYETGENDIPTAILIQLAEYYQTSVDYLLGRTNNKSHTQSKHQKPPEKAAFAVFSRIVKSK